MSAATVTDLQAAATDAEARLAALEEKVAAGAGVGAGVVHTFQGQLTALRKILVEAKSEQERVERERDEAMVKVAKMEYQCQHLKQALTTADEQLAARQ